MKEYPCDSDVRCPYITDESQATSMYFCRDNCGLGVADEDDDYDPFADWHEEDDYDDYEPDDSNLEVGYDPYAGCYTDDC